MATNSTKWLIEFNIFAKQIPIWLQTEVLYNYIALWNVMVVISFESLLHSHNWHQCQCLSSFISLVSSAELHFLEMIRIPMRMKPQSRICYAATNCQIESYFVCTVVCMCWQSYSHFGCECTKIFRCVKAMRSNDNLDRRTIGFISSICAAVYAMLHSSQYEVNVLKYNQNRYSQSLI